MSGKNIIAKTLDFQGSRISYALHGSGAPVVLLHGFGEDSQIWENQINFLKDKYLLIVPDLPGSGASEMLKGSNIQISDYAEAVKTILEEENITECAMIGHSMGGYIALAFAEKYPSVLSKLGLFHSGAYADDVEKKETRKKAISFIEENGSEAFLKTSIPGLFADVEESKEHIDLLIEKGQYCLPEALIQYYHAMIARPDRTDVLRTFSKSVLFIIGSYDKAIPPAHSLQQSHLPVISHIHILRRSAHMGMLEEKDKANEILAQFLH